MPESCPRPAEKEWGAPLSLDQTQFSLSGSLNSVCPVLITLTLYMGMRLKGPGGFRLERRSGHLPQSKDSAVDQNSNQFGSWKTL